MFLAVNREHLGPCPARRKVNNSSYTLGKSQGLLGGHYKRGRFGKTYMYIFTEVLCQGIQPQDGGMSQTCGDFSKHMPTCPSM